MLNKLKKHFPSLKVLSDAAADMSNSYAWFLTGDNTIIGIKKSELNQKEHALLTSFLLPYKNNFPVPTTLEKTWSERIQAKGTENSYDMEFRFVYFSFSGNKITPRTFKKAMIPFFNEEVPMLWESETSGILIEQEETALAYPLTYDQIADTLMSELYVKVTFFIGPYLRHDFNLVEHHAMLIQSAKTTERFTGRMVSTYREALPFRLMEEVTVEQREQISHFILQDLKTDQEMLRTIKTFIQCNLNISLTAKKIYMHRNSLQYRIDKFLQITGLDVRQFEDAVTAYLAILALMHKKKT